MKNCSLGNNSNPCIGEIKVTIVIPVYNTEKYLRECLDSVINQTMHEIQVICVNDGSADNSLAVLQEYAAQDSRIEIIDKPNGGVSSARNAAFSSIRGKYTYFIDSDDWIEPDLCSMVYKKAEESQDQITVLFYNKVFGRRVRLHTDQLPPDYQSKNIEKDNCLRNASTWNMFWQTRFLIEEKLYFPEDLAIGEDYFHAWKAILLAKKVSLLPEHLYFYRQRPGSALNCMEKKWDTFLPFLRKLYDYLVETGNYTEYRSLFIFIKLEKMYWCWNQLPPFLQKKMIKDIQNNMTEDDREYLRTSPKTLLSKKCRLFYKMVDGRIMESVIYHSFTITDSAIKMPERLFRHWIVKPLKSSLVFRNVFR